MIYAESDSEFEGYWEQLCTDAEGLGAKELYESQVAAYNAGAEIKAGLIGA